MNYYIPIDKSRGSAIMSVCVGCMTLNCLQVFFTLLLSCIYYFLLVNDNFSLLLLRCMFFKQVCSSVYVFLCVLPYISLYILSSPDLLFYLLACSVVV